MKKLLVLVLIVALIGLFFIFGCTNSTDNNSDGDNSVVVSGNGLEGSVLEFTTTTLDGETVSEDIFSDYDITMINIWATNCPGCLEEMPELAQLYEQLPENANLITLTIDPEVNWELAKEIVDEYDSGFMTLTMNDELKDELISKISVVPTSIFVDSTGKVVGDILEGAPGSGEELIENYLEEINDRME